MNVARSRGIKFVMADGGVWEPLDTFEAELALDAVAQALGYSDAGVYNDACVAKPREVEKRLKALL